METGAGITIGKGRVELRYETDQSEASVEQERNKAQRGGGLPEKAGRVGGEGAQEAPAGWVGRVETPGQRGVLGRVG